MTIKVVTVGAAFTTALSVIVLTVVAITVLTVKGLTAAVPP